MSGDSSTSTTTTTTTTTTSPSSTTITTTDSGVTSPNSTAAIDGFCSFDIVNGLLMDGEFPGCNLMQNLSVRMTRGNLRKLVPGGLALAVDDKLVLALTGYTMRIVRIEFANWDEDRVNLMFRGLPDRRRAKEDVTMTLTTSSADLTSPIATEVEVHRLSGDMADLSLTRVDVIASEPLTPRTVTPKTETDMVISRMVPETNLVAIIVPSVLGGLLLILCIVGLALWLRRRRSAAAGKAAQNEDYEAHATPMSKVGDDSARESIGSNRVSSRVETEYGAAPPLINSETDSDRVPSSTSGGGTMALSSGGGGTAALSSGGTAALSSGGGTGALGTKKRKSKSGTQDLPAISGTRRRNGARLDEAESKWELDRSELEMIEEIGRGDFAIVHKARYRGALVAVKTLMPHDDGLTESEFAAFRKEARVMASVPSHKNVVQLVGICTNDPEHFHIVTEFCDGGSLRERLEADRKAKTLEVPTQLRWALECAEGVLHLHHSSIVHRDLAARNLLLHNGAIKVADFGPVAQRGRGRQHHQERLGSAQVHVARGALGTGVFAQVGRVGVWRRAVGDFLGWRAAIRDSHAGAGGDGRRDGQAAPQQAEAMPRRRVRGDDAVLDRERRRPPEHAARTAPAAHGRRTVCGRLRCTTARARHEPRRQHGGDCRLRRRLWCAADRALYSRDAKQRR
jgi:hypothetical protein